MGVQGLWKLLESTGRPVSLESLEGKVLAVDVSLWLHQAMRGMRDEQGNTTANAHLHVLFNRICKLLFYRIKPVFVFDGSVPELKRQTMVARRQRREIAAGKSKKTSEKIIKNYLQSHALRAVMGEAGEDKTVPKLKKTASAEPDIFELPSLPPAILQDSESDSDAEPNLGPDHLGHYQNLEDVDIDSESFQALPLELQHEMILEMKEMQKRNSWKTLDQLPSRSSDFSSYQVNKLLHKGKMTKRIHSLRKEMSERNAGAMAAMLDIETNASRALESGRIAAEDAQHYLLIKRTSSKTENDQESTTIEDGEIDFQEVESGTSCHQTSELDCKFDPEVKGHVPEDAKCQRSTEFPWEESELVTTKDNEPDLDVDNKTKIANIVKEFFKNKTTFETNAASSATEIMDSDQNYHKRQMSDSESEKTEIDSRQLGKSVRSIEDTTDKKPCSGEVAILLDNSSKKEMLDSEQRTQKTDQSEFDYKSLSNTTNIQGHSSQTCPEIFEQESTSVENMHKLSPSENKILNQNLSKIPSLNAITVGEAQHLSEPEVVQEIFPPVDFGREIVQCEQAREVNVESSDDDDFVEVADEPQPTVSTSREELFPVSAFTPSIDASKMPSSASSPLTTGDILPQDSFESRNTQGDIAMDATEERLEENEDEIDDEDLEEVDMQRDEAKKQWESLNVDDVPHLQANLDAQLGVLQTERGKQDRVAASVTDLMYAESKELLQLFGVPYVDSPGEAEAQCAFLDETNLTQGTITDDSDVWLFGGQTIYKNFFNKGKHVECFTSVDVKKQLVLDRTKFILLAMLLGSDYTEGVKGVGSVTSMEVLAEFPGQGVQVLQAFRSWWDNTRGQLMPPVESLLKAKLRKLTLPPWFPNGDVFDAYWSPAVDESAEEFSWQSPDLGLLRDFAKEKLGWTKTKADEILLPVMKKQNDKEAQTKITNFFDAEREGPRKVTSKRLRRVLRQLRNPQIADTEDKKTRKRKAGGRKIKTESDSVVGKKSNKTRIGQEGLDQGLSENPKNIDVAMEMDKGADENSEDSRSSDEEYVAPKKAKIQKDLIESHKSGLRRSQRTVEHKAKNGADVQSTLAEFVEMETAVTRKTEGRILDSKQSRENLEVSFRKAGFVGESEEQAENSEKRLQGSLLDASEKLRSKNEQGGIKIKQIKKGGGSGAIGQTGKGKGRVGLKGKSKATRPKAVGNRGSEGPKLSESSSGDSD